MIALIAEKPSVAKDIARILGAKQKNDGYLEDNGYMVTWAFGHLIQLAMPEAYGFEGFKKENLPIIPEHFKHIVQQKKSGKEWKSDTGAVKQLKIIKAVFENCDKIIVATDAGREGELIFRLIYNHLDCNKPYERLWISSLTDGAIRKGLDNLQSGSDYNNPYYSARARSEADWLVGINATQALSIAAGKGVFSMGRVQTPTLSMICKRFIENRDFNPSKYWQIKATFRKFNQSLDVFSDNKCEDENSAKDIVSCLKDINEIKVDKIETKELIQQPPLLYDLTSLQKDANTKLNLSAEKTLSIVQGLYEKKVMSYPRTGSRYISEDIFAEIPSRIKLLEKYPEFSSLAASMGDIELSRKSVNDSKVTDHHALIITENLPSGLDDKEKAVYELVAKRMLEAFSGNCIKEATTVKMSMGDIGFTLKGNRIMVMGWRKVGLELGSVETENNEDEPGNIPEFYVEESLPVTKVSLEEKHTRPKPLHTEASILSAMETAGKEIEDAELRESIKDCGIGTPATRANIIETLLTRGYVEKKKKNLVPTEKGLAVYDSVKDMSISDVELTGKWEKQLSDIEKGITRYDEFMDGIRNYTVSTVSELLNIKIAAEVESPFVCPKCNNGRVKIFPKVAKCSRSECDFIVFRNKCGKQITDKQIEQLLKTGKTNVIKGFKNKQGKSFDASLEFDPAFMTVFKYERKSNS